MLRRRCAYAAATVLLAGVFFAVAPESSAMTVPMTAAPARADVAVDNGAVMNVAHYKYRRYHNLNRYRYRSYRRRHYDFYDDDFSFYGGAYYDGYPYPAFPYDGYYSQPDIGGSCGYWGDQCAMNWGYGNNDYYGCLRYHGCR
jgi:hypothetical protein